jgi:hypothetical protein
VVPVERVLSEEERAGFDFEVEFILGTGSAHIIDLKRSTPGHQIAMDVELNEKATEENCNRLFEEVCSNNFVTGESALCTIYPRGSIRIQTHEGLTGTFGIGGGNA